MAQAHLTPKMFSENDRVVSPGEYGREFVILLSGRMCILRPGVRPGLPGSHPDDEDRDTSRDRLVLPDDRAPMFGFSACLTKLQHELVCHRTDYWAIDAQAYCDSLWCKRKHFYECFDKHWLKGRDDMVDMAYYHYEVELILNSHTSIDIDADGGVSHEEFIEASARIPHGFASRFAEQKKHIIAQAKEKGHTPKGTMDAGSLGHQEHVDADMNATAESLMESNELLKHRIVKLDALSHSLVKDVSAIKQNLRSLVGYHNAEWTQAAPTPTSESLCACVRAPPPSLIIPQCPVPCSI